MKMGHGRQGWEVSKSDAREDTACLQPAGNLLIPAGQSRIWGLHTGTEVEQFGQAFFCIRPASVPSAMARGEAPGLSSCPARALDLIFPEGPAAAQL